jgi:hypothetical protein
MEVQNKEIDVFTMEQDQHAILFMKSWRGRNFKNLEKCLCKENNKGIKRGVKGVIPFQLGNLLFYT